MDYQLIDSISHSYHYNPGGITRLYLLNVKDYLSCRFLDDGLFTSGYIEEMDTINSFTEVACTSATSFTETVDSGLYSQSLQTFVNVHEAGKLSELLKTLSERYIVAFRNSLGKIFCFGTDGGASVSFEQKTGQMGEGAGYQITLSKKSTLPLFELNADAFYKVEEAEILITEDRNIITTEKNKNIITIKQL